MTEPTRASILDDGVSCALDCNFCSNLACQRANQTPEQIRATIATKREELAGMTVSVFAHSRDCSTARIEARSHIGTLYRRLVGGVDPRFVSAEHLAGKTPEQLLDFLAASRWVADSNSGRESYDAVCDGDCALDSLVEIEAALTAAGVPIPEWD